MEVSATLKDAGISAQKARLVANEIRGLPVDRAIERLKFMEKKAAKLIAKTLGSAVANAEHNKGADIDELRVTRILVDGATMLKRSMPRAKGRSSRILKRRCHIRVVVSSVENS